jgi:hypothetical protein
MREVCALASTLLGGVASVNSQVASSTLSAPTAIATSSAVRTDVISVRCVQGLGVVILGTFITGL